MPSGAATLRPELTALARELTLTAALRDIDAERVDDRLLASEWLATACLQELPANENSDSGRFRAYAQHPRAAEILDALQSAARKDDDARVRSRALISLGVLGADTLLELDPAERDAAERSADPEGREFEEEAWLLALAQLGATLPTQASSIAADKLGETPDIAREISEKIFTIASEASRSISPARRHGALTILGQIGDPQSEALLVEILQSEGEEPEILRAALDGLSRLASPQTSTLQALRTWALAHPSELGLDERFEAGLILIAAGDDGGIRVSVEALDAARHRDRALEALALMGQRVPTRVLRRIERLSTARFWPTLTTVRALYAWARIAPTGPARRRLLELSHHYRPLLRSSAHHALELLSEAIE